MPFKLNVYAIYRMHYITIFKACDIIQQIEFITRYNFDLFNFHDSNDPALNHRIQISMLQNLRYPRCSTLTVQKGIGISTKGIHWSKSWPIYSLFRRSDCTSPDFEVDSYLVYSVCLSKMYNSTTSENQYKLWNTFVSSLEGSLKLEKSPGHVWAWHK